MLVIFTYLKPIAKLKCLCLPPTPRPGPSPFRWRSASGLAKYSIIYRWLSCYTQYPGFYRILFYDHESGRRAQQQVVSAW